MAAWTTEKPWERRGCRRYIERASLGRRFESWALFYYCVRGYLPFKLNERFAGGEADLILKRVFRSSLVLVEVRGRSRINGYRPSQVLSSQKKRRLYRIASGLSRYYKTQVRMEFLEVLGQPTLASFVWGNLKFRRYLL